MAVTDAAEFLHKNVDFHFSLQERRAIDTENECQGQGQGLQLSPSHQGIGRHKLRPSWPLKLAIVAPMFPTRIILLTKAFIFFVRVLSSIRNLRIPDAPYADDESNGLSEKHDQGRLAAEHVEQIAPHVLRVERTEFDNFMKMRE